MVTLDRCGKVQQNKKKSDDCHDDGSGEYFCLSANEISFPFLCFLLFPEKKKATSSNLTKSIRIKSKKTTMGNQQSQQVRHEVKEIDGLSLHGAVLQGSSTFLVYDANLTNSRLTKYATRSVVGHFACNHCRPLDPWVWKSEDICTELWYAPVSGRYRTQLHSQKCKKCDAFAEPQVDLDDYVCKLTGVFQSWKDERPPGYLGQENDIWTDPHGAMPRLSEGSLPQG